MSYWSEWRAAHPEYRERQVALRRARRARQGRGDRSSEYARQRERRAEQRSRQAGDHGSLEVHPFVYLAQAFALRVARPDRRAVMHRPTYDDVVSSVVVALFEGSDPTAAAVRSLRAERQWEHRTCPLLLE